jgi:two-component system, OmpR family, response regulator
MSAMIHDFPTNGTLTLQARDLTVDLILRRVERAGRTISMRGKEFSLLTYLMWNRNRIVSHAELFARLWSFRFHPGTNRLEVTVARLRDAMDRDFDQPLIHTFRGQGYMLADYVPQFAEQLA